MADGPDTTTEHQKNGPPDPHQADPVPSLPVPATRKRPRRSPKKAAPKVPGKPGPVPLITPEKIDEICGYIAVGNYTETAVIAAGISPELHYQTMRNDPDYAKQIQQTRAYAEVQMVARVSTGSKGGRGALLVLERTRPQRFAPRQYIGLDRRLLGEISDGELAELIPLARKALTDSARESDSEPIDITPDPPAEGKGGPE